MSRGEKIGSLVFLAQAVIIVAGGCLSVVNFT
jgi:hypothetical protein